MRGPQLFERALEVVEEVVLQRVVRLMMQRRRSDARPCDATAGAHIVVRQHVEVERHAIRVACVTNNKGKRSQCLCEFAPVAETKLVGCGCKCVSASDGVMTWRSVLDSTALRCDRKCSLSIVKSCPSLCPSEKNEKAFVSAHAQELRLINRHAVHSARSNALPGFGSDEALPAGCFGVSPLKRASASRTYSATASCDEAQGGNARRAPRNAASR